LVQQIESCLREPKSELRNRRKNNFYAVAKHYGVPLPALRALLEGRRRLRFAHKYIEGLPPHRRAEVARLAQAIGDNSEIFQCEVAAVSFDTHLQALR